MIVYTFAAYDECSYVMPHDERQQYVSVRRAKKGMLLPVTRL